MNFNLTHNWSFARLRMPLNHLTKPAIESAALVLVLGFGFAFGLIFERILWSSRYGVERIESHEGKTVLTVKNFVRT